MAEEIDALIEEKGILDLSEEIRLKGLSPLELVRSCLDRARALNPAYNALITICEERALRLARAAEERAQADARLGDLDGIPITVKDMVVAAGVPTTNGSGDGWGLPPTEPSARIVANLERAGAIIIGKTNLHELGLGITNDNPHFGPARNPWSADRSPGGSSGGSAIAVALGLGLGAVGTDTGGSIRIPAAACGVFGLKPSYGLLSTEGVTAISWSLDHVGPLAARVEDLEVLLRVMADTPPNRRLRFPALPTIEGLRVGVPKTYFNERIEPDVAEAYAGFLRALEGIGAVLLEVNLPPAGDAVGDAFTLSKVEASYTHRDRFRARPENLGEDARRFLEASRGVSALTYVEARERQRDFHRAIEALFDTIEVLAVPATPAVPKRFDEADVVIDGAAEPIFDCMIRYTCPFNVSGHPSLCAPCPIRSDGLPVGVQIVGPMGGETRLLRTAFAYQQAALSEHMSLLAQMRGRRH